MWAANWVPANWAFCDGQVVAINTYQSLYAVIGPIYGGNGTTTFALPDFRGRVAIGAGMGPGLTDFARGMVGGNETTTIYAENLPPNLPGNLVGATDAANADSPDNAFLAQSMDGNTSVQAYNAAPANKVNLASGSVEVTGGTSAPMSNLQPYSVCHYIICVDGDYPQRAT